MQRSNNDFTVKLVGSFKVPEIKKLLPNAPQAPSVIYSSSIRSADSNEAAKGWESLEEAAKQPFVDTYNKQKALNAQIKDLAKKKFSLLQALKENENEMATLKENYHNLRVVQQKKPRRVSGFKRFSEEWAEKNPQTPETSAEATQQALKKAWHHLSKEQKSVYFKVTN